MYENLIKEAEIENIEVVEISFRSRDMKGLYLDNVIGLNKTMSVSEKACILAEELGHYHTTYGNILDQTSTINIKKEKLARNWGYTRLVNFSLLIEAFELKIKGVYDLADFLEVTPSFLAEAIKHYHEKYGEYHKIGVYTLFFNPLGILKSFE